MSLASSLAVWLAAAASVGAMPPPAPSLRVCADPNNMPFSDAGGEGFENKLAELLARQQGKRLRYVWWKQRRGWIRNTLREGKCDAWMGVASGLDALDTTRPYYRGGFMFLSRADRQLDGLTFDDARLRRLRIGVQLVGRPNDEATILSLAAQLEAETGWPSRRPPVG